MSCSLVPVDPTLEDPSHPNTSGMTPISFADVPAIRSLYEQYYQLYQLFPHQPKPTNEFRLSLALKLAEAMLKHYFPPSAGHTFRPASFNKLAPCGLPIQLDDTSKVSIHVIPPSLIAGVYVDRKYEHTDADSHEAIVSKTLPHTVFAIVVDDLATKPHWVTNKNALVIPGDLIGTSLGLDCGIAKGQGVLIMGPTIEFYRFDKSADIRRTTWLMKKSRSSSRGYSFAMDLASINEVDKVFRDLARMSVTYDDGVIAN